MNPQIMVKNQFVCDTCSKAFATKSTLKQHCKIHLKIKPWKCDRCPKEFCQKSKLIEHLNRHMGTPPYACDVCEKGFYQNDRLKTHKLSHSNERSFECSECSLTFRRNYELNKHLKMHDSSLKEKMKKYACEICGKKNYSIADLNRHSLKHTDKRDFKCEHCNKAFKDKYTLKCHEIILHFTNKYD